MNRIWQLMKLSGVDRADARLDMTVGELKRHIDKLPYFDLLYAWRHSPKNDPYFINEIGEHFKKVLRAKREAIGEADAKRISDWVGKGVYRG